MPYQKTPARNANKTSVFANLTKQHYPFKQAKKFMNHCGCGKHLRNRQIYETYANLSNNSWYINNESKFTYSTPKKATIFCRSETISYI